MTDRIDVLHVDDDPSVLDLTSAFLDRELDDVDVTSVTTPEDALDRLRTERFDCVVSDYDMPGMDGLTFFERLSATVDDVPFILFTGKGSEEIASRALNAGVTGYFQKGGPEQQRRLANRVERAIEEHRARVVADRSSTVLEALGYPIYVVDETGTFEFVNEPFAALTGYDREEIIGSKPGLIKDEDAVREAERRLGTILSSDGPDVQRFDVTIRAKNGESIPCRDHMAVLPYEGEQFEGSVGILRDVSDERRRRQELETKRRAMDEAPVGITITDPDREDNPMTYVNDRFVEMTGYTADEVEGIDCRILQGPDTDEESVRRLREAVVAGRPETVELLNYRKDGTEFWNRISIAPIRDADGAIANWVGFQEDITEFKQRERALERQNERLDAFASIVSHDLRNPLNVARGRVELARRRDGDEHLDPALDALDRMETIVDHTLTLAREGERVGDPEPVDLRSVAENSWKTVRTEDASLVVDTEREVLGDPDRLRNLFENLMRNAIQHAGTAVTVRIGDLENGFYVEDDGSGIPEENRETVFDPGYSDDADGTGFGLAIVREIADAHDWRVDVSDSPAGGARFEFRNVEVAGDRRVRDV
ncbi:hypothetical protein JCM18237_24380 [Halorubrum luteum]